MAKAGKTQGKTDQPIAVDAGTDQATVDTTTVEKPIVDASTNDTATLNASTGEQTKVEPIVDAATNDAATNDTAIVDTSTNEDATVVPLGDLPAGYEQTLAAQGALIVSPGGVTMKLPPEAARIALRLREGLKAAVCDVGGKQVSTNADAIAWLLLNIEK